MRRTIITGIITSGLIITFLPGAAFAHVVVTPNKTGIGEEQLFSISVPNERDSSVTSIKVLIPEGVSDVTPTANTGWTINTTKTDSKDDPEVTAITWNEGEIAVGQRQDFSFSAQVPAKATSLDWKAYQTYADGTTVHWDQTPKGSDDATGNAGPYSVTSVVDDLTTASTTEAPSSNTTLGLLLSVVAVVLSVVSLLARRRKS